MDVTVIVGDNEPIESALRRFKKDVSKSGHLFELRRRRYFETATEKRIRKAAASKRKARMARNQNNRSDSF
jgi:small subunit ribosomal protein S21